MAQRLVREPEELTDQDLTIMDTYFEGDNDHNDRTCAHFLEALSFAQRALWAAAIRLRPATEIALLLRVATDLDLCPRM
jgi:hypothetical protein